jgi:nucleoside-diphosphate kinase
MERTLVLVKPDGVQRALVGTVISRLEQRGLKLVGLKLMQVSRSLAEHHYAEHVGKGFYEELLAFITSSPIVAAVVEGPNAIEAVRQLMGKTNPMQAEVGTLRGDFALDTGHNLVHGSDSPASAQREIALFFQQHELADYRRIDEVWVAPSN